MRHEKEGALQPKGIEQAETETQAQSPIIPPQYDGLPSEVVEDMWESPVFLDPEKNASEQKRREAALTQMKGNESLRETQKEEALQNRYVQLPDEERQKFPEYQKIAAEKLVAHIQGKEAISALEPEENFVLGKLQAAYSEHKKAHPDTPFQFKLGREIDERVYNNLAQRLSFGAMESTAAGADQEKADRIRESIGLPKNLEQKPQPARPESKPEALDQMYAKPLEKLKTLLDQRAAKSKRPELYSALYATMAKEGNKTKIAEVLFNETNHHLRNADYPVNPNYTKAWELATKDPSVGHVEQNSWVYRGNTGKETITRGSLNITLTEDAVKDLDALIKTGVVDANYKFGEPGTGAEASDRHDAVTIYFNKKPNQAALEALSGIGKKYYRGDTLLGKKVADGFYMSEVGSVASEHAKDLIQKLDAKDPDLSRALKIFLTSNNKGKERVAMSEAQFYSVKETLGLFGYGVAYDKDSGFSLTQGQ